jgi:RNA polymerase primary sigma factor
MSAQSVSSLSLHSNSGIARLGSPARAAAILGVTLKFVDHASFDDPSAQEAILAPSIGRAEDEVLPLASPRFRLANLPDPPDLSPILSREHEAHLFRKMNFLKSRASRLKDRLDGDSPSAALLEEIDRLQCEAQAVKNLIVEKNMPLVIFVARKRVKPGEDLPEMISEGNLALIQAVDRFDFARGNRFSTYATWAIRNALVSKLKSDLRYRGRSFSAHEDSLTTVDPGVTESEYEAVQDHRRSLVRRWFAHLGCRERWILANRYGLGGLPERTLAQLARELGVSKQRVSQLAKRAENKLRKVARREALDAAEI